MKYEILKWRIQGKKKWEIIELPDEIAKAYGERFLKPVNGKVSDSKDNKQIDTKEVKKASNKALSNEETNTKWQKNS